MGYITRVIPTGLVYLHQTAEPTSGRNPYHRVFLRNASRQKLPTLVSPCAFLDKHSYIPNTPPKPCITTRVPTSQPTYASSVPKLRLSYSRYLFSCTPYPHTKKEQLLIFPNWSLPALRSSASKQSGFKFLAITQIATRTGRWRPVARNDGSSKHAAPLHNPCHSDRVCIPAPDRRTRIREKSFSTYLLCSVHPFIKAQVTASYISFQLHNCYIRTHARLSPQRPGA